MAADLLVSSFYKAVDIPPTLSRDFAADLSRRVHPTFIGQVQAAHNCQSKPGRESLLQAI
jgi:hypothetical protein